MLPIYLDNIAISKPKCLNVNLKRKRFCRFANFQQNCTPQIILFYKSLCGMYDGGMVSKSHIRKVFREKRR